MCSRMFIAKSVGNDKHLKYPTIRNCSKSQLFHFYLRILRGSNDKKTESYVLTWSRHSGPQPLRWSPGIPASGIYALV